MRMGYLIAGWRGRCARCYSDGPDVHQQVGKRPEILTVQEQTFTSSTDLATMLNLFYGAGSYVDVEPGGQTATDRLGYGWRGRVAGR